MVGGEELCVSAGPSSYLSSSAVSSILGFLGSTTKLIASAAPTDSSVLASNISSDSTFYIARMSKSSESDSIIQTSEDVGIDTNFEKLNDK